MTLQRRTGDVLPQRLASPSVSLARVGVKVAIVASLASLLTAIAWWLLAPRPELQLTSAGVLDVGANSEAFIAADGWFAVCAAAAGAVSAIFAFVDTRRASLRLLLALPVVGMVAAVVSWRIGVHLGPPPVEAQVAGLAEGDRFEGPLEVSALGVLVAWPLASVLVYFSLVAGLEPPPKPAKVARPRGRHRR